MTWSGWLKKAKLDFHIRQAGLDAVIHANTPTRQDRQNYTYFLVCPYFFFNQKSGRHSSKHASYPGHCVTSKWIGLGFSYDIPNFTWLISKFISSSLQYILIICLTIEGPFYIPSLTPKTFFTLSTVFQRACVYWEKHWTGIPGLRPSIVSEYSETFKESFNFSCPHFLHLQNDLNEH